MELKWSITMSGEEYNSDKTCMFDLAAMLVQLRINIENTSSHDIDVPDTRAMRSVLLRQVVKTVKGLSSPV